MKKESKLARLFKRDEILRNNLITAGFAAFLITTMFGSIEVLFDFLNNEIALDTAKYGFGIIGTSLLVFLGAVFMFTKAKKEHFNKRSVLLVSFIASVYFAIELYQEGMVWWGLLFGWAILTWMAYSMIKFCFKDISKSFFE